MASYRMRPHLLTDTAEHVRTAARAAVVGALDAITPSAVGPWVDDAREVAELVRRRRSAPAR